MQTTQALPPSMYRSALTHCCHTSSDQAFPELAVSIMCQTEVETHSVLSFCFQSGEPGCSLAREQSCFDSQSTVIRLLGGCATLATQMKWVSWQGVAYLRLLTLPR